MSIEREVLLKALELIADINKVEQLLAQPTTKQEPLTIRQGLTEYKKGYERGFDAAREDYKQKVINAFGVDDE